MFVCLFFSLYVCVCLPVSHNLFRAGVRSPRARPQRMCRHHTLPHGDATRRRRAACACVLRRTLRLVAAVASGRRSARTALACDASEGAHHCVCGREHVKVLMLAHYVAVPGETYVLRIKYNANRDRPTDGVLLRGARLQLHRYLRPTLCTVRVTGCAGCAYGVRRIERHATLAAKVRTKEPA